MSRPIENRVFVGGLPKDCQPRELSDYFERYGQILKADVKTDPETGSCRGFGFVEFSVRESVGRALADYDRHYLRGKWIEVKQATQGGDPSAGGKGGGKSGRQTKDQRFRLFVGGIPKTVDDAEISTYFEKYGTVKAVDLKKSDTGVSLGYAFVNFDSQESMQRALDEYSKHELGGKWVDVKNSDRDRPASGGAPNGGAIGRPDQVPMDQKIFVGGLARSVTEQEVLDYFSRYGPVVAVEIKIDQETKQSRGFGFVGFDHPSFCQRVLQDYAHHRIGDKWVEVKMAALTGSKGKGAGKGKGGEFSGNFSSAYGPPGASSYPSYPGYPANYPQGAPAGYGPPPAYGAAPAAYGAPPPGSYPGYTAASASHPPPAYGAAGGQGAALPAIPSIYPGYDIYGRPMEGGAAAPAPAAAAYPASSYPPPASYPQPVSYPPASATPANYYGSATQPASEPPRYAPY